MKCKILKEDSQQYAGKLEIYNLNGCSLTLRDVDKVRNATVALWWREVSVIQIRKHREKERQSLPEHKTSELNSKQQQEEVASVDDDIGSGGRIF